MNSISALAVPVFILIILIYALVKKASPFDAFIKGASNGMTTILKVFPSLLALIVAVEIMNECGLCDFMASLLSPVLSFFSVPQEITPLALMRGVSGSGSTALLQNIFHKFSPDSFISRCASVISGSTETTFYTIAIYFGASKATKMRHSVLCAVIADICCVIIGCNICRLFFS